MKCTTKVCLVVALLLWLTVPPTSAQEVVGQFAWADTLNFVSARQLCLQIWTPPVDVTSSAGEWAFLACAQTDEQGVAKLRQFPPPGLGRVYRIALLKSGSTEVFWSQTFMLLPGRTVTAVRFQVMLEQDGRERWVRFEAEAVPALVPPPSSDLCSNLDGVQTEVPPGYVRTGTGTCEPMPPPPSVDLCPNLDGVQTEIPTGMVKDAGGDCIPLPTPVGGGQLLYVQGRPFHNPQLQASPVQITLNQPVLEGSVLLVSIYTAHTSDVYQVPAGNGNLFEPIGEACVRQGQPTGNGSLRSWIVRRANGGQTSVELGWTGGDSSWTAAWVGEYRGGVQESPFELAMCQDGQGAVEVSSGPFSVVSDQAFVYSFANAHDGFVASGPGFIERFRGNSMLAQDAMVPTGQLIEVRGTQSATDGWLMQTVVLRTAASVPVADVCPNLDGVQGEVPAGMVKDASGNCVTPPPAPVPCASVGAEWQNRPLSPTPQTGMFTVEFAARPTAGMDGVMGLSAGVAAAYTDLAAIVRFSIAGEIDARNGSAYTSAMRIPFVAGRLYKFRMVVNVPSKTYNAYVQEEGGQEIVIGENFAFRSEQAGVTQLSNLGLVAGQQTYEFCTAQILIASGGGVQ